MLALLAIYFLAFSIASKLHTKQSLVRPAKLMSIFTWKSQESLQANTWFSLQHRSDLKSPILNVTIFHKSSIAFITFKLAVFIPKIV